MKILVIDDHAVARAGVKTILKNQVEEASPADALKAIRKIKPDVVLLGMNLGGFEILEAIKKEHRPPRGRLLVERRSEVHRPRRPAGRRGLHPEVGQGLGAREIDPAGGQDGTFRQSAYGRLASPEGTRGRLAHYRPRD